MTYIFPGAALAAVSLYYLYGAIDRVALKTYLTDTLITSKNFAEGSTTYNTNIVADRAWTQSSQNPDFYVVGLDIEGVKTGGLVTKEMYDSLAVGDRIHVKYQRTRLTKKLLITNVSR